MTFEEEIAELEARIAAVRAERDAGGATGTQQNSFDACRELEALERKLEGLRQQGRRAFAGQDMMADLHIEFRDGAYHVGARRYLRLEDAVSYAQLLRTQSRHAG